MGLENMRRWPMYIVFAVCFLLLLSLFNSWSMETELRNKLAQLSTQLQECSKQQSTCVEESMNMLEQRDNYQAKVNDLDRQMTKLKTDLTEYKKKAEKFEANLNQTLVDEELCKTELHSLQNLQISKSATLETLRLEKDTLTTQLTEKKLRIDELEKEVEKLKLALTTKIAISPSISKVTPAAQVPKLSSALKPHEPMIEPALENAAVAENAAKEEMEDTGFNDGNDFDTGLQ